MPEPQLNGRSRTRERPTYTDMVWEQLRDTKTEVKETRKELNARMDRLEHRMDRLEARMNNLDAKIDETRKELSNKIDALHNEIKSSTNHGQIATISTVGIALGVLYSILSK